MTKKISVAIAIKGQENIPLLVNCLESLKNQTYKYFEVILVGEEQDIADFQFPGLELQKIYASTDKNEARNIGFANATAEYVIYLDHDMTADKNLFRNCLELANEFNAIIIPEKGEGGGFWAKCRKLEKELITYDLDTVTPRFFKKNIFKRGEKPFDSQFGLLDEWGFNIQIKNKKVPVGISKSFLTVSEINFSITHEVKNKFLRGLWMKNFYKVDKEEAWRRIDPVKRGLIFYIKNFDYLFKDPIHFIGLLILKTVDLIAFLSGYFLALLGFTEKKVIQTYDNYGNVGENYLKEMYTDGKWNKYIDSEEKVEVARLWKLNTLNLDDEKILDLGMGPGRWCSFFLQYNFKNIVGMDISREMVKFTTDKIKDKRFEAVLGNMEKLSFEGNYFNKVFCFRALKYVPDYKSATSEMSRVLKKEGSFMFEVPNKSILNQLLRFFSFIVVSINPKVKENSRWGYFSNVNFFSQRDILKLFEGIDNISIVSINPFFVLPSIKMPELVDNYCTWILIAVNNIMFKILPKEAFARSWIVIGKKL
ncbi:MAG: methyltransferase domain-containing protein [Candidatus Daviesbacteria bacterium]|nr:methyltransferase domain-containing protein [Candidatus Daviesbacteria bacterium]